jgi:hypothetical protein
MNPGNHPWLVDSNVRCFLLPGAHFVSVDDCFGGSSVRHVKQTLDLEHGVVGSFFRPNNSGGDRLAYVWSRTWFVGAENEKNSRRREIHQRQTIFHPE